jgi:UDP-N-acetylglucosamine acyltransferase
MANEIHPTAIIDAGVELGDGNRIGPFAVISGPVTIGDDNWIGSGAIIGAPPEVRSFVHPRSDSGDESPGVVIGSGNIIREAAQIHQGTKEATRIGSGTFIMNQVYVAHDARIGDDVTIASSALLAGHVEVGARANIGLGASVHQFRRIGGGTMVGMGALVTRDLPPYAMAYGSPARVRGANRVGLRRLGVDEDAIEAIDRLLSSGRAVDASDDLAAMIAAARSL